MCPTPSSDEHPGIIASKVEQKEMGVTAEEILPTSAVFLNINSL